MGFFDKLKNKAKDIANSIEEVANQQEETTKEQEEAVVNTTNETVETYENEEEQDYQYSDKVVNGVHYPNGWEDLDEGTIFNKLDKVFSDFNDADGDDDKEDAVIEGYGFEDAGHYEDFKRAMLEQRADREGVSTTQAAVNQLQDQKTATVNAAIASDREDLQPVDGVSIELWAKAMAYNVNSGGDIAGTLEIMGKDQAGYDKVCNEWNTRMANDTTHTISQIYGAAFTTASTAGKPEINEDSFPFKKYVKVLKAMELLTEQGKDAQEVLAMFDMTVADWSDVGAFWTKKYHEDIEKYGPLHTKYDKKYEKKYAAGDNNSDIEF